MAPSHDATESENRENDLDSVARRLEDGEAWTVDKRVERIEVEPESVGAAIVSLDGSVRLVADHADLDASDNLTFYRDGSEIAHATVVGVPLEVPTLVRRAAEHGEWGTWE